MPVSPARPLVSAFSTWSSSPSSPSSDSLDDDDEHIVYPLSRPTSSASVREAAPYQPIPAALSTSAVAVKPSRSPSTSPSTTLPSPSAEHVSEPATNPSSHPIPPSNPGSTSPSNLFDAATAAAAVHSSPSSSSPSTAAMGFSFLRRSASVTDLPVSPSETRSDSYVQPRHFYNTPLASASTNDLPSLFIPPSGPSPPPQHPPTMVRTGPGGAIGPKAGARLLASREAQRALRKADELGETNGDEEFSIRQHVPFRPDGGLSTVTGSVPSEATEQPTIPPVQQGSSSGSRTRTGSNSTGIRRVPVPPLDQDAFSSPTRAAPRRENSLQELTRRASLEDQQQDDEAARRRQASLSKASGAGLASPFASPAKPDHPALDVKKRRPPPVAGLNKVVLPDVNEQGRFPSGVSRNPRQRSASADSRASVTKEVVLAQLGEAIKREKKKAEMYEREYKQSEVELGEIDRNLEVLKEKFATTLDQQEQVIQNLETEIEEVKAELERVNDLDEETAQEYLALLSSTSIDTLRARNPVVTAFKPNALTSSLEAPSTPDQPHEKSKFSALAFRRGLSLKRRVDGHLLAYGTVASNVAVPKPPLTRSPSRNDPISPSIVPELNQPRPRKLSKIRLGRAPNPSQEALSSTVSQPPQAPSAPPARPPPETPGFAPRPPAANGRPAPPVPAPVFPTIPSSVPSSTPPGSNTRTASSNSKSAKKRAPPVSGVSRGRILGGLVGAASDSDAEDGGVKGNHEPQTAPRKRSNSLSKTLRILFPSNAPKPHAQPDQRDPQQGWLKSDRVVPAFDSR